jgi:hypothetical protein
MRTLLQAIGEIIRPELRRDGTICLQEDDPGSRCGPVTLHKSGQALVLKLDGIPGPLCRQQGCQLRYAVNDRMFPLFDHHKEGLTSSCDYIIFYQDQQDREAQEAPLYIFLCELKSGRSGGARAQAENARLMADYIVAMARHHGFLHGLPRIQLRSLIFGPQFALPRINRKDRCAYEVFNGGMPDLKFAYCRAGEYPISYFCA